MAITKTTEQFIQEALLIHGDKYDYSLVKYTGAHNKVTIICKEHGPFEQIANSHLKGSGCAKHNFCRGRKRKTKEVKVKATYTRRNPRISIGSLEVERHLLTLNTVVEKEKWFSDLTSPASNFPLRFDFFIPQYNLLIEYDGEQHFKPHSFSSGSTKETRQRNLYKIQMVDMIKNAYAIDKNMYLLRISYLDINQIPEVIDKFIDKIIFTKVKIKLDKY